MQKYVLGCIMAESTEMQVFEFFNNIFSSS